MFPILFPYNVIPTECNDEESPIIYVMRYLPSGRYDTFYPILFLHSSTYCMYSSMSSRRCFIIATGPEQTNW